MTPTQRRAHLHAQRRLPRLTRRASPGYVQVRPSGARRPSHDGADRGAAV